MVADRREGRGRDGRNGELLEDGSERRRFQWARRTVRVRNGGEGGQSAETTEAC